MSIDGYLGEEVTNKFGPFMPLNEASVRYVIEDELRNVIRRSDEGLTPQERMDFAERIMEILQVEDGQAAYEMIHRILNDMEQNGQKYTNELRNAFGGEGYAKTLKARRQRLARELGLTVAGLQSRERVAIRTIAQEILAMAKARAPEPTIQEVLARIDDIQSGMVLLLRLMEHMHYGKLGHDPGRCT